MGCGEQNGNITKQLISVSGGGIISSSPGGGVEQQPDGDTIKMFVGQVPRTMTRRSCGECLKNLDPSTKSMSSVIKLPVKVKVRSKKQRLISVCDGVRVRWVVNFQTRGYQIKYSPIKVNTPINSRSLEGKNLLNKCDF